MDNNVNKKINEDESVLSTKHCPTLKIKLTDPETITSKTQEKAVVYNKIISKTA